MTDDAPPVRRLLARFARPHAREFGVGLALLVAAVVLQRVPALLVGIAVDALLLESEAFALPLVPSAWLPASTGGQAALTASALAAAVAGESAAKWYGRLRYERAAIETLHDLRVAAYDAAASLPMAFHDARDGGDVLGAVHDDVGTVGDLFAGLREGVGYGGGLLSAFAFMALLNWNLALLLLVVPVVLAALGRVYADRLEPRYDAVRASVGDVNVRVRDAIRGLATVKTYGGENTERDRVAAASGDYRDAKWAAHRLRIGYDAVSWLVGTAGVWGVFLLGGHWALFGPPAFFGATLSAGSLLTFLIYAESFVDPTRRLAVDVIDRVESARAASRRVAALFDRESGTAEDGDDIAVTTGRVAYDDVTFAYESADDATVDAVSLTAEPGEFVGVVGSTGAGKSTLFKLLLGFYAPDDGEIRVDGRALADVAPSSLREHVGYVGQEPFLVNGTVAENVAYGTEDANRERVVEATRAANAHEFVTDLPDGYDTEVGDGGTQLSGGQRQRLAVARALHGDPEVLVLDEATSSVDVETEAAIQRSLADAASDATVFAVAHRLATVRDADRILVLDGGEIGEMGTHDDLLDADGRYADLWRVQTGAVAAEGSATGAAVAETEVGR